MKRAASSTSAIPVFHGVELHNGVAFITQVVLALCPVLESTFDAKEWPAP